MNKHLLVGSLIVLSSSLSIIAQTPETDSRPIISSYALQVGGETAVSTYLSPLRYSGPRIGLSGRWGKRLPVNPERLSMQFSADAGGAFMSARGLSTSMYDAGIGFDWRLYYTWHPASAWSVSAGGGAGLGAGVLYKPSNGNNPAAAYADIHLALAARGAWSGRLGRLPVTVTDEVSLPSLSTFFSPEYAEPYYAIYLGYRRGLVNAGWWGNHFALDNLLNVRLFFGKRALDVGYRLNIDSSWVHHINTQRVSHSLSIGVTLGADGQKLISESKL